MTKNSSHREISKLVSSSQFAKREIEAKILDINLEEVKNKLRKLGAVCEREVDLDQVVWWPAKNKDSVRIRKSSAGTVRLTLKEKVKNGWGYNEWESEVENYDIVLAIFDRIFTNPDLRLEFSHKREDWKLNGALITINFVDKLNPFIEIEAESEEKVKNITKKLGLNPRDLINKGMVQVILERLNLKRGKIKL